MNFITIRPSTQLAGTRCLFFYLFTSNAVAKKWNWLKVSTLFTFFFFADLASAQKWIMIADTATNFYTVRDSFYKEWENQEYQRGKGYKQFKRWEWFMEPRVFPSGNLPNPAAAWQAIEDFNAEKKGQNSGAKSLPGGSWTPLGPSDWVDGAGWNAGNGRINVVVQDPVDANKVYVGAASGGLWRSTNGGTTWANLSDNQAVLGVSGIAIDPGNTNIIYIGTGDGDGSDTYSIGVLKSTDGGVTWNTTGLNWTITQSRVIRSLRMHPTNSNILFAATSNGVYKTTDAGATWSNELSISAQDIEFHPTNANIVYTCSDQFYRSTDGGDNFTLVTSGLPAASAINRFKIAVSADEPEWVYVVGGKESNSTFEGIYKSTNAGVSFTVGTNTPNMFGYDTNGNDNAGQSWYDMAIAVNPANADEVYIAGINIWKSTNGGTSFTIITQWVYPNTIGYVHADVHDLAFFGSRIYSGSDGGVFKSENFGDDWTNLTEGITIMQFYDIGGSPTNANLVIGGAQDNGTNLYTGTPTWTHVIGADGMNCMIDPTNEDIMYGAIQGGSIRKSTNGGASFSVIVEPADFPGESGNWVTPYALDPADPNTIFVGFEEIYKSTDGGNTWNVLGSIGNSTTSYNLEIAPSNSDFIYVSKSNAIYKSTNGGSTWLNMSAGLPGFFISDIAIDPADEEWIWVTLSNYSATAKVYQSEDGGNIWTNITANLPNLPANCIAIRPNSNDVLYVGMDVGIYTKNANETDWTPCVTDLPNVIINEIEINTGINKIQVGSYGRGAWVMDLPELVYCEPTFLVPCTGGYLIDGVVFGDIDNQGTGCEFPTQNVADYTGFNTALNASTTYPVSLTAGALQGVYFAVLIDFNRDFDFEDAGEFFPIGYANADATISGNIAVPASVSTGSTRMRILCKNGTSPITQAMICDVFAFGEAEDYSIDFLVPDCVDLTNPVPGSVNVPIATDLTWQAAGNNPTGYRLDVGTSPGGTDILNNFNVGNVTTYDPGDFPATSTIYVRIKPFNTNGQASGCPTVSFQTVVGPISTACLPDYDNECTSDDFIDDVTFNTISNLNTGCGSPGVNNYTDYTAQHTALNRGQNYTLTLAPGADWGQFFVALIDFNQDDFFTQNEFFSVGYAAANSSVSTSIAVPANAAIGTALMRIICKYDSTPLTFEQICGTLEWGEVEDYSVDVFTPSCTNLTSPANGAINVAVTAALNWAPATGSPTGYRLNVGTTPGGTQILNNQIVGNVTTFNPAGDFPAGTTIYVKITPFNSNGDATGCTEESFTTQSAVPACTSLTSPANGATNVAVTSALTWAAATGSPSGYRLTVGTTAGGGQILNNFDVGNVTTYNPAGDFAYGTTIYVKITPYNATGDAVNCTEESFTTQIAVPACTSLTSPANGATNVAVTSALTWAAANGSPTGYRLTVGTTAGGGQILNNFDVGNVTTYNPAGDFAYGTTIYVKITPYNATGDAVNCTEESFTTQIAVPDCTSLTSPANGATNVAVTSALTWAAATGSPSGYRLTVGTTVGGGQILNNFDVGNVTTYNPAGDFAYGTTIYVKITPYNATGDAVNCTEESFTTQIAVPACTNLTSPANGATNVAVTTTLNWATANGSPSGYRLTVGTTAGGGQILNNFDVGNVTTYNPAGDFAYGTTIFVKITPYNATGDAVNCTEESFTTQVCIPNLDIANMNIPSGTYRSTGDLTASNDTIAGTSVVVFKSDTGILLQQDFTVDLGGQFDAEIEACPTNFTVVLPGGK